MSDFLLQAQSLSQFDIFRIRILPDGQRIINRGLRQPGLARGELEAGFTDSKQWLRRIQLETLVERFFRLVQCSGKDQRMRQLGIE